MSKLKKVRNHKIKLSITIQINDRKQDLSQKDDKLNTSNLNRGKIVRVFLGFQTVWRKGKKLKKEEMKEGMMEKSEAIFK